VKNKEGIVMEKTILGLIVMFVAGTVMFFGFGIMQVIAYTLTENKREWRKAMMTFTSSGLLGAAAMFCILISLP